MVDLDDLITTIPGVLVDGFGCEESSSGFSRSSCSGEFLKFHPGTSWLPVSNNVVSGGLGYVRC